MVHLLQPFRALLCRFDTRCRDPWVICRYMYLSTEPAGPAAHLVPYLVNRAGAVLNRAWREQLREHGVTIARWQVLSILAAHDGARLGQLARMSGAEQATTTRVVDQMER